MSQQNLTVSQTDIVIGALTAWRENRGGGITGMQSVINVLTNRAIANKTSIYTEATKHLQFSSMTAKGDPNLIEYPDEQTPVNPDTIAWGNALQLMNSLQEGNLKDLTNGATSYYATSMKTPPSWAKEMIETTTIAGQVFLKEEA